MIQLYVTYYYRGSFFNEESVQKIDNIDDIKIPENAFGYHTFKREIIVSKSGRDCTSERFETSKMYYEDAEYYTLKQLKERFPEEEILIRNVEGNNMQGAVRTRMGNWQQWEND